MIALRLLFVTVCYSFFVSIGLSLYVFVSLSLWLSLYVSFTPSHVPIRFANPTGG